MEKKKRVFVTILLLVLLASGFWLVTKAITSYTGYFVRNIEDLGKFSKCVGEKTELYVNEGCPNCEKQEKIFIGFLDNLNIIDCGEQAKICIEKEVRFVPTWIINNEKELGFKNLQELSEITGCKLEE